VVSDFAPHSKIISFQNPLDFINEYHTILKHSKEKTLLLLDVNMPEMRGYEMIELLEEEYEEAFDIDIIMVTSSNLKIDMEKATRYSNIIGFVEKPLSVEKITNTIQGII
jgi:two-component system, NarL family, nitrate/nitrite response regulator NarL